MPMVETGGKERFFEKIDMYQHSYIHTCTSVPKFALFVVAAAVVVVALNIATSLATKITIIFIKLFLVKKY